MELGLLILGVVVLLFVVLLFVLHFVGGPAFVRRLVPTAKREPTVPPLITTQQAQATQEQLQVATQAQLLASQQATQVRQQTQTTPAVPTQTTEMTLGDLMPSSIMRHLVGAGIVNDKTPQTSSDTLSQESATPEDGQLVTESAVEDLTDRVWMLTGDYPGNNTREREIKLTSPLRQTIRLCKEGGFLRRLGSSGSWSRVDEVDMGNKKVGYTASGFLLVGGEYQKKVKWACRGTSYTLSLSSL